MQTLSITFIFILFTSFLDADCNGFNWYHKINPEHCDPDDINTLKQFILNSGDSLELDMDVDFNGKIDVLELGWQLWEDGRLVHWICQEVPSPYYFYEYDCGLSGSIPDNIGNLDALIKLRLQSNNLSGEIPESICKLKITNNGQYWFNITNNNLCPSYPDCVKDVIGDQYITNCK